MLCQSQLELDIITHTFIWDKRLFLPIKFMSSVSTLYYSWQLAIQNVWQTKKLLWSFKLKHFFSKIARENMYLRVVSSL